MSIANRTQSMRLLRGTVFWTVLVLVLCVPLGAMLFPGGWNETQGKIGEAYERMRDRGDTSPAESVTEPAFEPTPSIRNERTAEQDLAHRIPAETPRNVLATSEDAAEHEVQIPEPPKNAFFAEEVADELVTTDGLDELDWADTTGSSELAAVFDPDRLPRELTPDEDQQVRQGYRSALETLRKARAQD